MNITRTILCFIFAVGISSNAHAFELWPFGESGIDFTVEIKGVSKDFSEDYQLEELALQALDKDNPPKNITELKVTSGLMSARLRDAMHAAAYYDVEITSKMIESDDEPTVVFDITQGQRYAIGKNTLKWEVVQLELGNPGQYFLTAGAPAKAADILKTNGAIKKEIAAHTCFITFDVKPRVILDKKVGKADVEYQASHGRSALFGTTTFTGDSAVSEDVLRKYIKWEPTHCFDQKLVDRTQTALLSSQLLASAQITLGEIQPSGQVPITINVKDRPHRTITAGANFTADEGFGVSGGWEHRNVQGLAHKFSSKLTLSQNEYSVNGQYGIPFFYRDNQRLNISGGITQENTDEFDSTSIGILASVDRQLTKELSVGAGGGARFSNIKEAGEKTENFGLVYFPVFAEWDDRDNSLNSTKGIYARATIAPYADVTGQGVSFLKSDITAQTYLTAEDIKWKPTLALRAAYGQINGASASDVPADLRFYAGGGGSVRGYNFRAIGPRENGEADGGTAWTELSAETRFRFTEEFGGVVFLDAGSVYRRNRLDPNEKLFLAAGAGVRYFSPIGPLRFDVGVPLDEVEDDANFGVYVSIGQAF